MKSIARALIPYLLCNLYLEIDGYPYRLENSFCSRGGILRDITGRSNTGRVSLFRRSCETKQYHRKEYLPHLQETLYLETDEYLQTRSKRLKSSIDDFLQSGILRDITRQGWMATSTDMGVLLDSPAHKTGSSPPSSHQGEQKRK